MISFHVVIRAKASASGAPVALPISFEELAAALERIDRCYFEPDGSFVWSGETPGGRWQLDGMLYDLAGQLQYVDLKAAAPRAALDKMAAVVEQLLAMLGTPLSMLAFDLVQAGRTVNVEEFREALCGECTDLGANTGA